MRRRERERIQPRILKNTESNLIEVLHPLQEQWDTRVIIPGIPTTSTLKELHGKLPYEVIILVQSDHNHTSFLPGAEARAHDYESIRSFDLPDFCSHSHNHPHKSSTPSGGDLLTMEMPSVVRLTFGIDDVCEYKTSPGNILEDLHDYLVEKNETPWRTSQYQSEYERRAIHYLSDKTWASFLSPEEREIEIRALIRMFSFSDFIDFYTDTKDDSWRPHMRSLLIDTNLARFHSWDDDTTIQEALRGHSHF